MLRLRVPRFTLPGLVLGLVLSPVVGLLVLVLKPVLVLMCWRGGMGCAWSAWMLWPGWRRSSRR